jgi:hypothetical protein
MHAWQLARRADTSRFNSSAIHIICKIVSVFKNAPGYLFGCSVNLCATLWRCNSCSWDWFRVPTLKVPRRFVKRRFVKWHFVKRCFVKIRKIDFSSNDVLSNDFSSKYHFCQNIIFVIISSFLRGTARRLIFFARHGTAPPNPPRRAAPRRPTHAGGRCFWPVWPDLAKFWLILIRPLFEFIIGVASWVRRGRRPRPALGRPNPIWQPQF